MLEIVPFNYEDIEVRTVVVDDQPWFVGKDACQALGLRNHSDALGRLDKDGVGNADLTDSLGRSQSTRIISEAGLYELIFQSRVPSAQQFKRWVTHEVLPTIRKTGGAYLTAEKAREVLADPTVLRDIAQTIEDANQRAERAIKERESMKAYAIELEPKADGYDSFMAADGTFSVGDTAKILGIGRQTLFNRLHDAKVFIRTGDMRNTPYAPYQHHFIVRASTHTTDDGRTYVSRKTYVKPSGLTFIQRKLGLSPVQMPLSIHAEVISS